MEEPPLSVPHSDFIDIEKDLCWECIRCGKCCGNIFSKTWLDVTLLKYILDPIEGYCPNYNTQTHLCSIHNERPNICKGYPFIIRKSGDQYKLQVHNKCSGLGKGRSVNIKDKVLELVKYCEEEYDMNFLIDHGSDGNIKIYHIK